MSVTATICSATEEEAKEEVRMEEAEEVARIREEVSLAVVFHGVIFLAVASVEVVECRKTILSLSTNYDGEGVNVY